MLRLASTSISPKEMLITSMPSRTAASTAAASSTEFSIRPSEVGVAAIL
jgi:hypothetical protein